MATPTRPPYLSLLLATLLTPLSDATGQTSTSAQPLSEGRLLYIGDSAQLSVGLNHKSRVHGEFSGVLHETPRQAWLAEIWGGQGEGGLKLSHHQHNTADSVLKLFAAIDQNASHDRKITLGYGQETPHWFGQVSLSQGLTGKRLISQQETSAVTEETGQDALQRYLDTTTTILQSRWYAKAYDHGIGLRIGRHIEPHNIRLSAGLDHEWGHDNARQSTASLLAEKMFPGTPHSIALQLSHAHQTGPGEPTRNDNRGMLIYRYSLGRNNAQAERRYQLQPIIHAPAVQPLPPSMPPAPPIKRIEKQWVKTKAIMNSDAFFEFDSAKLTPQAQAELQRIAELLQKQGREGPMHIIGHTCDIGSDKVNDRLSLARAQAVKNHLLMLGAITEKDASVQGQGKRAQKYPATAATRAKNRRVELEFFSFIPEEKKVEVITPAPPAPAVSPASHPQPIVTYERIPLEQPPAWIQRALRTHIPHNRTVSVYRIHEQTKSQNTQRQWLNQPPAAQNDQYTLFTGSNTALNVLDNDRDPDANDTIRLVSVTPPKHGQVALAGRQIIYTAPDGLPGTDNFSYTIQDSQGLMATAQVQINLITPPSPPAPPAPPEPPTPAPQPPDPPAPAVNRAPQANPDRFGVSGKTPSNLAVLSNDTDPDGDALTITGVQQPIANSGRVEIGNNSIVFTPNYPFMIDWFTYSISDGKGGTSKATVQLVDP